MAVHLMNLSLVEGQDEGLQNFNICSVIRCLDHFAEIFKVLARHPGGYQLVRLTPCASLLFRNVRAPSRQRTTTAKGQCRKMDVGRVLQREKYGTVEEDLANDVCVAGQELDRVACDTRVQDHRMIV